MKTQLLEKYEVLVNAKVEKQGAAARQIVEKYWDETSDRLLEKEMLPRNGMPDSVVFCVLRDLATRFPSMNEEIKALRS